MGPNFLNLNLITHTQTLTKHTVVIVKASKFLPKLFIKWKTRYIVATNIQVNYKLSCYAKHYQPIIIYNNNPLKNQD